MAKIRGVGIVPFKPHSGAVSRYERIVKEGKLEAFAQFVDELYPDGVDSETVNGMLWFEPDWVFENLGMKKEGEEDPEE